MTRLLQDKIKRPLAEQILFGKLENGGSVKVTLKDGDLHFTYKARKLSKSKKNSDGAETEMEHASAESPEEE